MRSWHDFHITGYKVDGKQQDVTFNLEWPYASRSDIILAKVQFLGVECYFLEHDLGGNIVYSFKERDLRSFLEEWTERFEHECKWGWPRFWRRVHHPARDVGVELEESFNALKDKNIRCIELSSSYGLSGWILATEVNELACDGEPL